MKRKLAVLMMLGFILGLLSAMAGEIRIAWDASPDAPNMPLRYSLRYGTASRTYTQSKEVGNALNCTLTGAPGAFFSSVYAINTTNGVESDPSNEVIGTIGYIQSFDNSYLASGGLTLNRASGIASGNVVTLPADPKSVHWAKTGLLVAPGQILTLGGRMYYGGDYAPVSVYLVDEATGSWLSPERVIFVDSSYAYYQTDLIVTGTSDKAKLYICCGQGVGLYQFQQIAIVLTPQAVNPATGLYLSQLLPRQSSVGLYSAKWDWKPAVGSQGYIVRTATFRDEIEKGDAGILLDRQLLSASQTSFRRDIDATLYSGIYVAVTSLIGGQESIPYITWYMPGNIINSADKAIPPLCSQGGVTLQDVNYVYTGYATSRRVPAPTPGQPAGWEERADVDNDGYAGRGPYDFPFNRAQFGKFMK